MIEIFILKSFVKQYAVGVAATVTVGLLLLLTCMAHIYADMECMVSHGMLYGYALRGLMVTLQQFELFIVFYKEYRFSRKVFSFLFIQMWFP